MRYFWLGSIFFIFFSIQSQQPPRNNAALEKSLDICQSLATLRKSYQDIVDTNFAMIQAHLIQKAQNAPDLSQTNFSCIIDRENDHAILEQLTQATRLILRMHELEEKLEKTDNLLTQNTTNVLELWNEHEIDQEIAVISNELFESLMKLAYRQAIRTHQKASAVRGAVIKLTKS